MTLVPLGTEKRSLLLYFGLTLAALGLLLVPAWLQRDSELVGIVTPIGMGILRSPRCLLDGLSSSNQPLNPPCSVLREHAQG